MQCVKPIRITKNLSPIKFPDGLTVPCGKCVSCRIAKRREWSTRMLHELNYWDKSSFLTLTYSEKYIPRNLLGMPLDYKGTLEKKSLQKFIKRLRRKVDRPLKYFACGEYGDETNRPHYHLILFGVGLDSEDRLSIMECWPYCEWKVYQIYKNSFGLAEVDSIRYVAQYIDKKYTGDLATDEYLRKGREEVFRLMSQGIGKRFVEDNKEMLLDNEQFTVNGVKQGFPRYYLKLLGLEDSDFRKDKAIESDETLVEKHSGLAGLTFDEFYRVMRPESVRSLDDEIKKERTQREKNINAKMMLTKRL